VMKIHVQKVKISPKHNIKIKPCPVHTNFHNLFVIIIRSVINNRTNPFLTNNYQDFQDILSSIVF